MKGIILAAGKGTRLYPMTLPVCKPLLPVYDKPMIYYPLSVLMQAGIKDILIITPPDENKYAFERLLGDGSKWGIHISYDVQKVARGTADAILIAEEFIDDDDVCLIFGDNIFWSESMKHQLLEAAKLKCGAVIFGCYVDDPRPFGVVEFDEEGHVISLEEKPMQPKSNYIVPGLYFYDNQVIEYAKKLTPSNRGELEITDLNMMYLKHNSLKVQCLELGMTWMDAGTADSLLESAQLISEIQKRENVCIGCLEEIALNNNWISKEKCMELASEMKTTQYGQHLLSKF